MLSAIVCSIRIRRKIKHMVKQIADKSRKELGAKLANVFTGKMGNLSTELQEILIDDLVTAFENRLNVLNRAKRKADN
jgi:hypothetical protein